MPGWVNLQRENGATLPLRVWRCDTFLCRLRGLMFRRRLRPAEALLFVEAGESRAATAIHMLFVFCSIGVVWLNNEGVIVDKVLARPFRPFYAPRAPARYYLEAAPEVLEQVTIGERLQIVPAA